MRNELGVGDLDERDYSKNPLSEAELKAMFADLGRDPREFLNSKSPTFKKLDLVVDQLSAAATLKLMAQEPNLLKRPILIAGETVVAGFDRDRMRAAVK